MTLRDIGVAAARARAGRTEPLLEIDDIQGNILAGFDTAYQDFVFLRIVDVGMTKKWLTRLAPAVTTMRQVLRRRSTPARRDSAPMVGVGFGYPGLTLLAPQAQAMRDVPFTQGLHQRSRMLGDPIDERDPGHCANWIVGGPATQADIVLVIACDDRSARAAVPDLAAEGVEVIQVESCARLPGPPEGHEHFGFRDPISQPGVRGRISADPDVLLHPSVDPARPDEAKPGQKLVWPGEFVFGYPTQDPFDPWHPGLPAQAGPTWGRNGSLLVLRRLRQDVDAFEQFISDALAQVHTVAELATMTREQLRARLMGRWRHGTPVMLSPAAENLDIAYNAHRVDNFGYAGDRGTDPLGLICPQAAHIRKAYPRDHETSVDTKASMETHRILRRGMPFGSAHAADRGLLFAAYQTSLERQFEYITRSWLNNPYLRAEEEGHDPIAGQYNRAAVGSHARGFSLPYLRTDGAVGHLRLTLPRQWTVPTGGGYFFVPSITALRNHIGTR
ncbi:Dyp-type peroxidase [Nocardia sp. NBC_01499]|uniref:Dyp-type peroxidase n=1 Tax=Nocardia sp. NBC_01499 TaxID=2903597 RepID=UPI0038630CEA